MPVPANDKNKNIISQAIDQMDSNMGGTEMDIALNEAYKQNKEIDIPSYLFLITDGEIYDHKRVIENAVKSEMRHFIIGVGYATDAILLKNIAQSTAGSFENVDPNEEMDQSILTLFKKIDMPKTKSLKVQWPEEVIEKDEPKYLYDGDTLFAMAKFHKKPIGKVMLDYELEDGTIFSISCICKDDEYSIEKNLSKVAKIVANTKMMKLKDDVQVKKLSVKYQLFSEETKYLLIDEVDESEKVDSLPVTHKVKQMLTHDNYNHNSYSPSRALVRPRLIADANNNSYYLDIPAYMMPQQDYGIMKEENLPNEYELSIEELIESLPDYYIEQVVILLNNNANKIYPRTLTTLKAMGVDRDEVIEWIETQKDIEEAVSNFIRALILIFLDGNYEVKVSDSILRYYKVNI